MAQKTGASIHWGGLDTAMGKAVSHLANKKLLLASIGETLASGAKGRFVSEEDPEGKEWQPSRRAQEEGGKTLTDTAQLRDSIDYATTTDKVMVGSNKAYAAIHQFGGTIKPKHAKRLKFKGSGGKDVFVKEVTIPARPFIGVSKEDMQEVKATIGDFLAGAFKGK